MHIYIDSGDKHAYIYIYIYTPDKLYTYVLKTSIYIYICIYIYVCIYIVDNIYTYV